MAIIKDFVTPHGVLVDYHRIVKVEVNVSTLEVEIVVAVYASAEARNILAAPLWHEYVKVPFSSFEQDPREAFYPVLWGLWGSYLRQGQGDTLESSSQVVQGLALTLAARSPPVETPDADRQASPLQDAFNVALSQ